MIPSFPTDSLYKFMAFSGLFVAGFSYWFALNRNESLNKENAIARDSFVAMMTDANTAVRQITALQNSDKGVHALFALGNDQGEVVLPLWAGRRVGFLNSDPDVRNHWRGMLTQLDNGFVNAEKACHEDSKVDKETMAKISDIANGIRGKIRNQTFILDNIWIQYDNALATKSYPPYGMYGGPAISLLGFVLWWFCLQRHQDKLVKLQIKNEQAKLDAAQNQGNHQQDGNQQVNHQRSDKKIQRRH